MYAGTMLPVMTNTEKDLTCCEGLSVYELIEFLEIGRMNFGLLSPTSTSNGELCGGTIPLVGFLGI